MKKKVFSLMMALVLGLFGLAQAQVSLPYSEDFENGIGSWTMSNCHSSTGVSTSYGGYESSASFRFYYTANYPQYLISPELTGGENGVEVSFFYARYSSNYPETFQVGYSTTTNATSAFTWESEVTATNMYNVEWLEYTTTCPAGTKYVAVKCTSNDQFYLFVDGFTFTAVPGGGQGGGNGGMAHTYFHLSYVDGDETVVDGLNLGVRPSHAMVNGTLSPIWMAPFPFTMYNTGSTALTITNLDFTPSDGTFTVNEELPFTLAANNGSQDLTITTNHEEAGIVEQQFVAFTDGIRAAHIWDITAEFYTPECPDVWELAYDLGTITDEFSYVGIPSQITPTELHNDYTLPFPEIPEGQDAVYKLNIPGDMIINAYVDPQAENGKVALYTRAAFDADGGPMADNNYVENDLGTYGGGGNGGGGGAASNLTVYDGEITNAYVPCYGFYADAYLKSEMVYPAAALTSINGQNINSLTFYASSPATEPWTSTWRVFLTEVASPSIDAFNGQTGATVVYEGLLDGTASEMTINFSTPYHYNGGNLLVGVYNTTTGNYKSVTWVGETVTGASVQGYSYSDLSSITPTQRNFLPKTTFGLGGRVDASAIASTSNFGGTYEISEGPVIENLPVRSGEYYLVASATQADYTVYINVDNMPCPEIGNEAMYRTPVDGQMNLTPASVELTWQFGQFTTEWRLVVGTTYFMDENHPQTIVYPANDANGNPQWSTDLSMTSYTLHNLWNNTQYFWKIQQRNSSCATGTDTEIWGFTTHLNPPTNLKANGAISTSIFEDEPITLTWNAIQDRTFRQYFIYLDGEKIGETTISPDPTSQLSYTIPANYLTRNYPDSYVFNVTTVYDEGESGFSNDATVQVGGYGTQVNGHVWERYDVDGNPVGIANATVTLQGVDELGRPRTYTATTNASGYYEINHVAINGPGSYDAKAECEGYQTANEPIQGEPVVITYNQTTTPIDFRLDENFVAPLHVWAEYIDVNGEELVKVWWAPSFMEMTENFEGDWANDYEWNNSANYPWGLTSDAHSGSYALRSSNAGVASSTSAIDVTLDIPMDGQLSFWYNPQGEGTTTIWDKCQFFLDGVEKFSYGANNPGWHQYTQAITAGTHNFKWSYTKDGSVNPTGDCFTIDDIVFVGNGAREMEASRTLDHFRIYRTNCYNNGDYYEAPGDPHHTILLGTVWVPDTAYIDVSWNRPEVTPAGVYKWGVGAVYSGNLQQPRESEIVWAEVNLANNANVETADRASASFDFEDGAIPTGWTNDATYPWTIANGETGKCIKSSNAGVASTSSTIETTWNYTTAGTVSFDALCEGEGTSTAWDKCIFSIDGTQQFAYGAHVSGWNHYSFDVTAGPHTFTWSYTKDSSVNPTGDAFSVDNVAFTEGTGGGSGTNPEEPAAINYLALERESPTVWSNCLDKDMQTAVTVNVLLNSADSPEGTTVSFTNLNEYEQSHYAINGITLDSTGYYAYDTFRKGEYAVQVRHIGYYTIFDTVSIWEPTNLRYVMEEILYGVQDVYVSRTGWVMWENQSGWEGGAGGGASGDLTVYDGTATNSNIPVYGLWMDDFTRSEMIYPADELSDMNGSNINSMKFYISSPATGPWDGTSFQVYMTEVTNTTLTGSYLSSPTNATVVYTGAINGTGAEMTINFDTPYHYNGGNLLVGIYQTMAGTYYSCSFYGQNVGGASASGYNSSSPASATFNQRDFLPKTTFNYGNRNNSRNGGSRHLEGYKVMCTSIDGVQIFNHDTPADQPFCQLTTVDPNSGLDVLIDGERYLVKVCAIYSTGQSAWCEPVLWQYERCDDWGPVDQVEVNTISQGNHIEWVFEHGFSPIGGGGGGVNPGQGVASFTANFEGGMPEGWTVNDANNDGWTWCMTSAITTTWTYYAGMTLDWYHSGTNAICSGSYINGVGALNPDEWLISPLVNLTNGSQLSFWVAATDENYPADHFGVFVSTTGTNPSDFTSVQEWTLSAKGSGTKANVAGRGGRSTRLGTWYNYTVDLSAYAGDAYIAFRHFNCTDQYIMCLDDIELSVAGAKNGGNESAMNSGMLPNGTYALNITDIVNFDERVCFIYNLLKDNRFEVVVGEGNSMFIISKGVGYESIDLEMAINDFMSQSHNSFAMMDKVQAAETANSYKGQLPASIINALMMDLYIQSRENNMCEFADPFCTDNGMYEFPAGVNAGSGETGPDYDCLYTTPNPAWYYMRIGNPGSMDIHMYSTPSVDIDFCCWGPFEDPTTPCPYGLTEDKVVSCSYSTSWTEHCMIPSTAQTGEYYILVITNYSNQTCNINFSMESGTGSTDCGILPPVDIIGFLITQDGEYLDIVGPTVREYTDIDEFGEHEYCVRVIYPGPAQLPDSNYYFSMSCPVCETIGGEVVCAPGADVYAEAAENDQVRVWWGEEEPLPPTQGDEFTVDFDNSAMPAGWTTIDANNDGYNWVLGSQIGGVYLAAGASLAGSGHNASNDMICSGSFSNATGQAITPDNYLVSPQVTLGDASVFSFWACAQDAGYAAEHFGVGVSTTGTNPSDFTMVFEDTMTAKGEGAPAKGNRSNRDQGNWYHITVDLSAYAGQQVYLAIRHFNCNDQFILNVDDIALTNGAKSVRSEVVKYKVYRSTDNDIYEVIAEVPVHTSPLYEYFDTPAANGTYYYQVTAVYSNECESEPAASGVNPDQNYVSVDFVGMGENVNNVALYPNPTKGNITIKAAGMSRVTVVSVLGQVVFDTELTADEYVLNMAQFNAGMYMVRIFTENGVTVKRVTVMQ